jgi:hypothetical protein
VRPPANVGASAVKVTHLDSHVPSCCGPFEGGRFCRSVTIRRLIAVQRWSVAKAL